MKNLEEYRNSIDQKAAVIFAKRRQRTRFVTSSVACFAIVAFAVAVIANLNNVNSLVDDNPII